MVNYYRILELADFAPREAVKAAFKRLAFRYHPDRNPNDAEAEAMFKNINEAHRLLNDPNKKYRYDELLRTGASPAKPPIVVNHENGEKTYYQRPNPDPKYRRRAPSEFTAKTREQNPYLPTNTQMSFIAIGLVIYVFFLVRTVFVSYAKVVYVLATKDIGQRDYRSAYEHLNQAVANAPADYQALALKGQLCGEHLFYYYEAVESYTQAIKHAPNFRAEYFLKRGMALSQLRNRKAEANSDFGQAAPHYLNDVAVLQQIAEAYYNRLRNYDKALKFYKLVSKQKPKDPGLHQILGEISILQGKYDAAALHFDKAIVLDSQNSQLYYKRAICHFFLQDKPRACGDWQRAQQFDPNIRSEELEFFCNYKEE